MIRTPFNPAAQTPGGAPVLVSRPRLLSSPVYASAAVALGPIAGTVAGTFSATASAAIALGGDAPSGVGTFSTSAAASPTLGAVATAASAGTPAAGAAMVRRPWTTKPPQGWPLDPTHPLCNGLVGLWVLNEGAGPPANIAGQFVAATSNTATWAATPYGRGLGFNGSSQFVGAGSSPAWSITGPLTVACLASPTASAQQNMVEFRSPTNAGGYSLIANSANTLNLTTAHGGVIASAASSASAIDGNWHCFAASMASTGSGGVAFYRDGQAWGTGTIGSFPTAYGTGRFGVNPGQTAAFLNGSLALAAIWNRALSAQEHAAWAMDPWQVFLPARRPVASAPASGAVLATASVALGVIAANASGAFLAAGSASPTPGPIAATATATFLAPGSAAVTIGPIAATATATFLAPGSAAVTIGPIVAAATSNGLSNAAATVVLAGLSASSPGTFATAASAAPPLGPIAPAGTGSFAANAAGSATLAALSAAGAGLSGVFAAASPALGGLSVAVVGTFATAGSASAALGRTVAVASAAGGGLAPSPFGTVDADSATLILLVAPDPALFLADADAAALIVP